MWSPTHVSVIIRKARNLLTKGKENSNNAFVTIELGRESYRTTIKEKVGTQVIVWDEECEFKIPTSGNTATITITALHRNSYGFDKFLGVVYIPLSSFGKHGGSTRWYKLLGKTGEKNVKERGEIEVTIDFSSKPSQSLLDLNNKKSRSFASLLNIKRGGKVLSFREVARKALKGKDKKNDLIEVSDNSDPGVVTDEEEQEEEEEGEEEEEEEEEPEPEADAEAEEEMSSKNTSCNTLVSKKSLEEARTIPDAGKFPLRRKMSNSCLDLRELSKFSRGERKCFSSLNLESPNDSRSKIFSRFSKKFRQFQSGEKKEPNALIEDSCDEPLKQPRSVLAQFNNKTREELITMIIELQRKVNRFHVHVLDLEEYLDRLLVKVMETSPTLLEKQSAF